MALRILVVGAAGGLGQRVVTEALARGHAVSALVRSSVKLREALGAETAARVVVHEGDGAADESVLRVAAAGADAIVSAGPPSPALARAVGAAAAASAQCKSAVWTAGGSNILEADGKTLHHKAFGPAGDGFFAAHAPCIENFECVTRARRPPGATQTHILQPPPFPSSP